jgi:hypothetical protein
VAAPWPVPVAVIVAAVEAQRAGASPATGAVCAGIGLGCILGTTGELAIIVNLAASAAGVLIQQVVASHVEFGREGVHVILHTVIMDPLVSCPQLTPWHRSSSGDTGVPLKAWTL